MTYEDGYYIVETKKSKDSVVAQCSNGDWTVRGKNITQKNIEKNYEIGFLICKSTEFSEGEA